MRLSFLALALSVGVPTDAQTRQTNPCPSATEQAREIIVSFEEPETLLRFKDEIGLSDHQPGDARALGTPADTADDRAACHALNEEFREAIDRRVAGHPLSAYSYFAVGGGRYLVVDHLIQVEGRFRVGTDAIYALSWSDGELTYLAGVAF